MARAAMLLESIEKSQRRTAALPEFRPGDSIKVWAKIREGEKTRLQAFEGVGHRFDHQAAAVELFDQPIEVVKADAVIGADLHEAEAAGTVIGVGNSAFEGVKRGDPQTGAEHCTLDQPATGDG